MISDSEANRYKMSSRVSNSVVQRGRVVVHIAENGHSFECDCDENTLVNDLQRFLETVSGTRVNDQLLVCLDMKLEKKKPLSAYKLPSDDRDVFLFNVSSMRSKSLPPSPESIEIVEIPTPPSLPSSSDPHPLDDSPDPALKALPSYERIFRYHFKVGQAYYSRSEAKLKICEKLLGEQKVQERAMEIARVNLDHLYRMILQYYADFRKCYWHQNRSHSSLMMNFERDVEKLKQRRLHPALQTAHRKCLLDFVKEDHLQQKVVDECGKSLKQFEKKVSEFEQDFDELKMIAEELFSSKASSLVMDSERAIKNHCRHVDEQKSILESFSKDVNTVKKLIHDSLSKQLTSSLRPHDAVSALGLIYDGQDKNCLPKLKECDLKISHLLDYCRAKKNEMNIFLYKYMQKVAYVQYAMKGIQCRFSIFKEAMNCQSDQFQFLRIVHGIGPAYRACLAEIVRRKSYFKLYMGMAGQLVEKLATDRDVEVRRREEFLRWCRFYIPTDILATMGLYDKPNMFQASIAPFDGNLLDVDISDLDRYCPEYSCGSLKGSFNKNDADFDELVAASELFEVAGTNKIEVENVKLKADLASAIARMCTLSMKFDVDLLDDESKVAIVVREAVDKTSEALRLKEEYEKQLGSLLKEKQMQCDSYEKRVTELEQRLYEVLSKVDVKPEIFVPGRVQYENMKEDGLTHDDLVLELEDTVSEKSNESKLKTEEDVSKLEKEVNTNDQKLLEDSMQSALSHFHDSEREEEYISAIKIITLFERLRKVVISTGDILEFPELLRVLSDSLASSIGNDDEENDDNVRECIQLLAQKVGVFSSHNAELIEKYTKENEQLKKELDEYKEMVVTLKKQANNQKLSFGHLQVDEVAAFVHNSETGHYEAIHDNRRCGNNYYLSAESVSLLTDHLPNRPIYVIGKIVHIEPPESSTTEPEPLDLRSTSLDFIVTVAMLP